MKILNKSVFTLASLLVFGLSSCDKDNDNTVEPKQDPLSGYEMLGEQTMGDMELKLYAAESPFVGYNQLAIRLLDSDGESFENASVMINPMMDMGAMMHSTPHTQPQYQAEMNAYMANAAFIMPDDQTGSWMIHVMVDPGDGMDTTTFEIDVVEPDPKRLYGFVSAHDSTTRYFVTLKEPMNPEVGMNDFELMIYQRESMMSFPGAMDLQVEIEPEMPTMGHGSPNNENPEHVEGGLYRGKVNFTMSGYWEVHVTVKDGDGNILNDDISFNITFE